MDQARILRSPSKSCRRCQRPFHHWSRVNVRSRFEIAQSSLQSRFKCSQPLQQHLVIIARPSHSFGIYATAPRIPRNPPCSRFCGIRRSRLRRVVVRKTHNCRPRPRKWHGRFCAHQFAPVVSARQVAHSPCATRVHPLSEPLGIPARHLMWKFNHPRICKPCFLCGLSHIVPSQQGSA